MNCRTRVRRMAELLHRGRCPEPDRDAPPGPPGRTETRVWHGPDSTGSVAGAGSCRGRKLRGVLAGEDAGLPGRSANFTRYARDVQPQFPDPDRALAARPQDSQGSIGLSSSWIAVVSKKSLQVVHRRHLRLPDAIANERRHGIGGEAGDLFRRDGFPIVDMQWVVRGKICPGGHASWVPATAVGTKGTPALPRAAMPGLRGPRVPSLLRVPSGKIKTSFPARSRRSVSFKPEIPPLSRSIGNPPTERISGPSSGVKRLDRAT